MRSAAVVLLCCIAAAGSRPSAQAPPSPSSVDAARPSFTEWLAGIRAEALSHGIRQEVVDRALATVEEPLPIILERDRAQAETVLPLEEYLSRRLKPKFVKKAREMFTRYRTLLEAVGVRYGVPPRIIVG